MVKARHFGNDQTALWALKDKWRHRITDYGAICERLGIKKAATMTLALYTEIAELELELQRHREMVAEREM